MASVKLAEIATVITKGTTPTSVGFDFVDDGINFVKIESITEDGCFIPEKFGHITEACHQKLARSILHENDLLFSIAGAIGRTAIVNGSILPANTNQALAIIRIPEGVVDYSYLKYVLESPIITQQFEKKKQGVAQLNISLKDIGNFIIPLPSLTEQKSIVSILSHADTLISLRKQQIAKLDELVKARFVEMTREAGGVPTRMGDIATFVNGYAFKPTDWSQTGRPIIRIQNLNNPQAEFNYFQGEIDNKYLVHDGDVLISWATHFEAYCWTGGDAWLNQHIFRVDFNKIHVDKMYFIFATEEALRQAFRNAHGFKPTMEHLKRKDFEDAVVVLPELATQRKFAAFVAQTDQQKLTIQHSLDKLELLKKALMQKYFG